MTKREFILRAMDAKKTPGQAGFAIIGIEAYKNEYFFDPSPNWPDEEYYRRCIEIWTANEIISRIRKEPFEDPLKVTRNFIAELVDHRDESSIDERRMIFKNAVFAATEIEDFLHCMC